MAKVNKLILEKSPTIEHLDPLINDMMHYIHDNGISHVVVGGSSAQPVAVAVKRHWKKKFPNEPLPHFIALGKIVRVVSGMSVTEIRQLFFSRASKSGDFKSRNCFVLEEYMSSGNTMVKIHLALNPLGFKKVLRGSLLVAERSSHLAKELDFAGALSRNPPKFDHNRRTATQYAISVRKAGKMKELRKNALDKIRKSIGRKK